MQGAARGGRGEVALGVADGATVVVGFAAERLEPKGGVEVSQGALQVVPSVTGRAAVGVSFDAAGVDLEGRIEVIATVEGETEKRLLSGFRLT